MDRIIPWATMISIVQPFYYKGERGNKPYSLELMLKIFILQNLYDLADMKGMNSNGFPQHRITACEIQ